MTRGVSKEENGQILVNEERSKSPQTGFLWQRANSARASFQDFFEVF